MFLIMLSIRYAYVFTVMLGTIQGSKNGPRFFDIYSNDMNFLLNDNQNILYADDTAIVYVHENLNVLTELVNEKLALLYD